MLITLYPRPFSRYPKKHRVMVGFMATFLREEGE